MNGHQIIHLLTENREQIRKYGVDEIALFGSYSRTEETPHSDIDILVKFKKNMKSFDNYMDLKFFLEDLFGIKVDLTTSESIKPEFSKMIEQDLVYA